MNVAFCVDQHALIGLSVTLSSLIQNCSDSSRLQIWILCSGVPDYRKNELSEIFKTEKYSGLYYFIDFNPMENFALFPSLHGDYTTYGRLLLSDLIDERQILYLDSDLVVELDILDLENFDFKGLPIAAVGGGSFQYALGTNFYTKTLGIAPEKEYFNAGVLLFNLNQWRQKQIKEECFNLAKKIGMNLPSHDQSLLNIYCNGDFAKLPLSFNCSWAAGEKQPTLSEKMIFHFIGAPKPWDPFGSFLHNGHSKWKKYTRNNKEFRVNYFSISSILRLWHLRRSYVQCVLKKIEQTYNNQILKFET